MESLDLGVVDRVELGIGLFDDPAVGQDARAMDQPPDRTEFLANPREDCVHRIPRRGRRRER